MFFNVNVAHEVIAEVLFVFDIGFLCFITAHLRHEFRVRGFYQARLRLGNQAAVAIGIHIAGLSIIRGWSTLQYWTRDGLEELENSYPVSLVGFAIAVVGMACCIRIFSPYRWGNIGWIIVFLAAIGFALFMQLR